MFHSGCTSLPLISTAAASIGIISPSAIIYWNRYRRAKIRVDSSLYLKIIFSRQRLKNLASELGYRLAGDSFGVFLCTWRWAFIDYLIDSLLGKANPGSPVIANCRGLDPCRSLYPNCEIYLANGKGFLFDGTLQVRGNLITEDIQNRRRSSGFSPLIHFFH